MSKLLTIVVPTYNMEAYLNRCLDSLLVSDDQMQLLEVLVINDGSKDNSSAIAHEYEEKYPNTFRVIDKENGNYGSCINRGLKEATGKYIKVLDADDWFDTTVFAEFITILQNSNADLIISDFSEVDENGNITKEHKYKIDNSEKIDKNPQLFDIWMHAVTYKTNNLRLINYQQTEGISYTDQEWIFHPMVTIKSIKGFEKSLYQYLVGRAGQTVDMNVWHRNMSHEIKTLKNRILLLASITDYGFAKNYLLARLEGGTLLVYKRALLYFCDNSIVELDQFIREKDRSLYDFLETSDARRDISYKFVKHWHRTSYNVSMVYFMYKLLRIIYAIKNKISWTNS